MKPKLGRTLLIFIFVAAALAIALIRPWRYLMLISPQSALTVTASSGKLTIKLNGRRIGETPYSAENLTPGDYDIELARTAENSDLYYTTKKRVHLEPETRTYIKAELGPSQQFSSFALIYFQKNNTGHAQLFVKSQPQGARVWLDETRYGETPISSTSIKPGTYTLKIEKEGYETIEVKIQAQEGLTLIADIEMIAKPIELNITKQ